MYQSKKLIYRPKAIVFFQGFSSPEDMQYAKKDEQQNQVFY